MTYQYRIYPSLEQEAMMVSWLETCRKVYNYALSERKDWLKSRKAQIDRCSLVSEYIIPSDAPYPNYYLQKRNLTQAKKILLHLKEVHSQVLQDVLGRVDSAVSFMKQRGYGFPRFKKFGQYRSFYFPQLKGDVLTDDTIKLPKIGEVPVVLHRPIPQGFKIKACRVVKRHSGWYVMLTLQCDADIPNALPKGGRAIGIDVGLEYFLSTSDGEQVARPRFLTDSSRAGTKFQHRVLNKHHRQLQLLQRCLKRKRRGSNRRARLIQKIGRVHEQIKNARLDWQFKLAHRLCDRAEMIFAEDLDFRVMAKGFLGKHTLDAGLGQFLNQVLPWVCFKRGVYYSKVDASGTSQECPDCGAVVKKDLSVRVHQCTHCGSVKPRDIASGQVICARGLSGAEIASGWDLSGIEPTTQSRQDRVKEEAKGLCAEFTSAP